MMIDPEVNARRDFRIMVYTSLKANADHFMQIFSGINKNATRIVQQGDK